MSNCSPNGHSPTIGRAGPRRPCLVCGQCDNNCNWTADGLLRCRTIKTKEEIPAGFRFVHKTVNGFFSVRSTDLNAPKAVPRDRSKPEPPFIPPQDWLGLKAWAEANDDFRYASGQSNRTEDLATKLGVPAWALLALGCCWVPRCEDIQPYLPTYEWKYWDSGWAFPMRDGNGNFTGCFQRYDTADEARLKRNKGASKGSHGHLFYPDDWHPHAGPILCPEGVSDTVALVGAGLNAVGRF